MTSYVLSAILTVISLLLSVSHTQAHDPMTPSVAPRHHFDRVLSQMRSYHERPPASDRIHQQLYQLLGEITAVTSTAVLPRLRRLIRAGATTQYFVDYELGGGNLADLISDVFLAQDLRYRPSRALFRCVSLLVAAGPAAVTNRRYAGNGGITSAQLIEPFLLQWRHLLRFRGIVETTEPNARIMYGQCIRLLQMIYAQKMIYEIPDRYYVTNECRYCYIFGWCADRSMPTPRNMPDYVADLIVDFIRVTLCTDCVTGMLPTPSDDCSHDYRSLDAFGTIPSKVCQRIFQRKDVYDPILNMVVSNKKMAKAFLNGLHQSKESRRVLAQILRIPDVADHLLRNDLVLAELIRRKDVKSLEILVPKMSDERRSSLYNNEVAQLRGCKHRIEELFTKTY